MKQYGLFLAGGTRPMNVWNAEDMSQNGEYVYLHIFNEKGVQDQVAAIRLDKGQSVSRLDMVAERPPRP